MNRFRLVICALVSLSMPHVQLKQMCQCPSRSLLPTLAATGIPNLIIMPGIANINLWGCAQAVHKRSTKEYSVFDAEN